MAHPIMFRNDDPLLARVRDICLALPGATERISHGRPFFSTSTGFAMYGGSVRGAKPADRRDHGLLVKADPDELDALVQDDRFFDPAYLGPSGWVGLDLAATDPDWDEVAELVDASFRQTAPRTLIAELDARG